jgi:ribosomal protein L24E
VSAHHCYYCRRHYYTDNSWILTDHTGEILAWFCSRKCRTEFLTESEADTQKPPLLVQLSPRRWAVVTFTGSGRRQEFEKGSGTGRFFRYVNGDQRIVGTYEQCWQWIEDNTEPEAKRED